jgi:hypothetical protein
MRNETRRRAEDCPPYRQRIAYVRLLLVGRVTPCAPPCDIRHSDFVIDSSFHIPNRRESRDRFADPRQLGRCNYLINIFVSTTCFLREACP